jgi:asparagine synthase (glutamine-hydrolysing)
LIYTRDDSSSVAQALWGLDMRDPTSDRDLVEFCLTFPPSQLVGGEEPRPVFRAAFGDDLPDAVHRPARRGLQAADWFEHFSKDNVAEEWRKSAKHDQVNDLFDVAAISNLISCWPTSGWENLEQNLLYRNDVLGAVSLANFIRHRF